MDRQTLRGEIEKQIEIPRIPNKVYSVLNFGAVPGSEKIQTARFQQAIDDISAQGGGKLVVPAGRYRTGALRLKDKVELHLESEETVLAFVNEEPGKHYPVVFSHWEGTPCYNYSALIYACDAEDIAVTGKGTLDGCADENHWWNWHHQLEDAWSEDKRDMQSEDRALLRKMNEQGIPFEKRVFGPGHYLRPKFVQPIRCRRVLFEGFTIKRSPMWQLNPVMCESVTVDGVTLSSHGKNNDGCDPESCSGVHIKNCRFDTGDDCISLKSGRDRDGREADRPCEYVLVENNVFADGHGGIALGSEMSGGIRHVLAVGNHFDSPNLTYALRMKTNAKRGGCVEDIFFADCVMDNVHGAAVHGTMLYEDGRDGDYLPEFKDITVENVTAHGGDYGIFMEAFEEVPVTGLVLKNISIDGVKTPMWMENCKNPVIDNVTINGKGFPRPSKVRLAGIPVKGERVRACAQTSSSGETCAFSWYESQDGETWKNVGLGKEIFVSETAEYLRAEAENQFGNKESSSVYRVISKNSPQAQLSEAAGRLFARGILREGDETAAAKHVTRGQLSRMLLPFIDAGTYGVNVKNVPGTREALELAIKNDMLPKERNGLNENGFVSRQEMATVAMQACGARYLNASTTMPDCKDADRVGMNYGTNVARAIYLNFMPLDDNGCFKPEAKVTVAEAVIILNKVADFAGL